MSSQRLPADERPGSDTKSTRTGIPSRDVPGTRWFERNYLSFFTLRTGIATEHTWTFHNRKRGSPPAVVQTSRHAAILAHTPSLPMQDTPLHMETDPYAGDRQAQCKWTESPIYIGGMSISSLCHRGNCRCHVQWLHDIAITKQYLFNLSPIPRDFPNPSIISSSHAHRTTRQRHGLCIRVRPRKSTGQDFRGKSPSLACFEISTALELMEPDRHLHTAFRSQRVYPLWFSNIRRSVHL